MKINMPLAGNRKKSKFDLSSTHITTMSMTQLKPVNILPTRAGENFNIDYGQFTRLSPLVAPTYGSFTLKTFAFHVPLRTIWTDYQNFMENTPDSSLNPQPLNFSLYDYFDLVFNSEDASTGESYFLGNLINVVETTDAMESEAYDFAVRTDADVFELYNFNSRGVQLYNILIGLGYELPTYFDFTSSISREKRYSLLPLLAYCRCMYDYVYPSAYVQQQGFGYLFTEQIYERYLDDDIRTILMDAFRICFVPYTQDYWTSLWARPNSVALGSQPSFSANGATSSGDSLQLSVNNERVALSQKDSNLTVTLTDYGLRMLTNLSDFCLRNNIGGTRFHEFMKSHFGFVTREEDSTRSKFLKSWTDEVKIGDVTNMTSVGVQGEMTGKGYAEGNGSLRFECDSQGFLIFISMVVPQIGYYQGLKPWCNQITSRENLYIPEYDNLGMVGIPRKYLFNCAHTANEQSNFQNVSENAFGYAQRYSLYKIGHDFLTGDFRLGSRNVELGAYHTFRDVTFGRDSLDLDARFRHVDNQYQRIFAYMGEESETLGRIDLDTFFTIFQFKVEKYSDMLTISEAMPFFDRSGENVAIDYEGNQL